MLLASYTGDDTQRPTWFNYWPVTAVTTRFRTNPAKDCPRAVQSQLIGTFVVLHPRLLCLGDAFGTWNSLAMFCYSSLNTMPAFPTVNDPSKSAAKECSHPI